MSTAIAMKFAIDVPDAETTHSGATPQCDAIARCSGSNPYNTGPLISMSSMPAPSCINGYGKTPLAARLNRPGFRVFTHWRYFDPGACLMRRHCNHSGVRREDSRVFSRGAAENLGRLRP